MADFQLNIFSEKDLLLVFPKMEVIQSNPKILQVFHHLQELKLPFITDLILAYNSLGIRLDEKKIRSKKDHEAIEELLNREINKILSEEISKQPGRSIIEVPICFDQEFGPDLVEIAKERGKTRQEVIDIFLKVRYQVYMLGFLPGFPYMGWVDAQIEVPRKQKADKKVMAGSVGIAGRQTGIYPLTSPGGWNIIGRTPLRLFDPHNETSVVLNPGDEVKFYEIKDDQFEEIYKEQWG